MLGENTCKYCGCTDLDCSRCIEKTGEPCYWVAPDVCSACEACFLDSSDSEDPASSENSMEATTILSDETHEIVAITHPSIHKNVILEEIPEVDALLTTDNYKVEHIGAGYAIVCFLFKES